MDTHPSLEEQHAEVQVSFRELQAGPTALLLPRPFITGIFAVGERAFSAWVALHYRPIEPRVAYATSVYFLVPDLARQHIRPGDWFHILGQPTDLARGRLINWDPSRQPGLVRRPECEDLHADPDDPRFRTPPDTAH